MNIAAEVNTALSYAESLMICNIIIMVKIIYIFVINLKKDIYYKNNDTK